MSESRGRSKERSSPTSLVSLGQTTIKRVWTPGPTQILNNFRYSGTLGYKREAVAYEVNEGPPYKTGGPFKLLRYELIRSHRPLKKDLKSVNSSSYYTVEEYDITEFGDFSSLGLPNSFTSDQLNDRYNSVALPSTPLSNYGAEAMNKINPTNISKANLALSLVELWKEGLPSIPGIQSLKKGLKRGSTGGEYLNVEFGWKPLVTDILNVIDAFENSVKVYNQLVRDNGRKVRRRATVFREVTNSQTTSRIVRCYPVAWNRRFGGDTVTADTRLSTRVWTVGRGSYFIPDIQSQSFKSRLKQELLGARPNLALIYELMPWSWMIDWVSNVGEVIQYHLGPQVSEFVIDYAYLMRHVQKDITYSMPTYQTEFSSQKGSEIWDIPGLQARERFETKERIVSSSFGFGLTPSGFSSKQWAILAALGVSKTRL